MILPFSKRLKLADEGKPVLPELLMPDELPAGIDLQIALAAIVMTLAEDGATLERGGLLPHRAREYGPLEQNEARDVAMELIPDNAYLRKVGMDIHRKRLILTFDFPDTIERRFGKDIEQVIEQTGWDVHIKPAVNQQSLGIVAEEIMPEGVTIKKGPSYHMDKRQVHYELSNVTNEQISELSKTFRELTGYDLVVSDRSSNSPAVADAPAVDVVAGQRIEINAAYGLIRSRLDAVGLSKTSLKQGSIVLSFISPQVGERYIEEIQKLSQETGYPLRIHPHPNQHQIMLLANKFLRETDWTITKGPGIHTDRAELSIKVAGDVDASQLEQLNAKLVEATGFKLVVDG
jgi:hypothetical protein